MSATERDEEARFLSWLTGRMREDVAVDGLAVERLKRAVRASAPPARAGHRRFGPRTVRLAPLPTLAGLAGLAVLAFMLGRYTARTGDSPAGALEPTAWTVPAGDAVRFVFTSEAASRVSLVGDFNDWDPVRTPLRPTARKGVWSIDVPLPPGRHEYAFLVDGERWVPDRQAPIAPDGDFGSSNSVVLVRAVSR